MKLKPPSCSAVHLNSVMLLAGGGVTQSRSSVYVCDPNPLSRQRGKRSCVPFFLFTLPPLWRLGRH